MLISYSAMPSSLKRSRSPDDRFAPRVKRLSVHPSGTNSVTTEIGWTEKSKNNKLQDCHCEHFVKLQELHSLRNKRKFEDVEERTCGTEQSPSKFCTVTQPPGELHIFKTKCQQEALGEKTIELDSSVEYHRHKRKRYNTPKEFALDSKMADVDSSFNSFNYWKPLLPEIDDDLMSFMGESFEMETDSSSSFGENTEFNSFNFWKAPIPVLDMDIDFDCL